MKRLLTLLAVLTCLVAPALAGLQPTLLGSRLFLYGNWPPGVNPPEKDYTHYPNRGYLAMFGTDTAYSIRMFCGAATGRGWTFRMVAGTGDTTRIDSTGIYTTGNLTVSGPARYNGGVSLGDSATDHIVLYGQTLTSNRVGSSNWITLKTPGALTRPSLLHIGAKLTGSPTAGYWNTAFFNTSIDTAIAAGEVRGLEAKFTSTVTGTGTAKGQGVYGKVSITGASKTWPWAAGVNSMLDIAATNTLTLGYNYYAEHANSGTSYAAILGSKDDTWRYGVDFNGATFTAADVRLSHGGVIADVSATMMLVKQDTINLDGVVQTAGGPGFKLIAFGTDSIGVIIGNDTFHGLTK